MNITKTDFIEIAKKEGFDDYYVDYLTEGIFDTKDEVDLKEVKEEVLKDLQDSLNLETSLRTSGDISYIINYLESYKAVIKELEDLENAS